MDESLKNGVSELEKSSGASNAGVILTSTLWNQSGTIYVSVDGEQTALSGYTYNKFSPCADGSNHSLTGCSNTADAQIIYYWIEKGYDIPLAITTEDYCYINTNDVKHYVSNYPTSGEGAMNEVNKLLASTSRIGNGNFIAALCYFCGVNNHSTYKSGATSTSWSYTVSHTGSGAAAFKSAGFDSYYFIARKASGSVAKTFFAEGDSFTEVGFSILRENLDYGEVIRIGIPSHAVYMDGYRVTKNGYEYHLNYGWGIYSDKTDWYTVEELDDLEINYITIDISPDVSVRVTTAAGDYRGGSFVRGIERINHIVNDKSTTFTFADDLAGKTIALSAEKPITSAVDVEFENIRCTLATTAAGLFSSGRGMSFGIAGGSLIVNSTSAQYVIRETGNSAVNVTIDDGFIYSGYYSGGVSAVRSVLALDEYSFGKLSSQFRATVSGYAVQSGSGADCVTVGAGSAILGGLSLGTGNNTLNIGAGSLFYGTFAGTEKTLTVNLTVDDVGCSGATAALADAASEQAFLQATGGVLNLTFDAFATGKHTYEIYRGINAATAAAFAVNLKTNGKTVKLDSANREYGCCELVYDGANISLCCDLVMPEVTSVAADVSAPTNGNVTVTAKFSANATTKEYSLDNQTWQAYTAAVVMKNNGTVYFRAADVMGNRSTTASYKVANIDRTPPAKPSASADITAKTNQNVTVTAKFSSDSVTKQYSLDSKTWQTCTAGVVMKNNGTVYFRAADAAGNTSEVASFNVSNIDRTPPEKPTAAANITTTTNKNVTVSATFSSDSVTKQYSINNAQWSTYTGGVVLSANGKIRFRGIDAAGNVSEIAEYVVSNIDKTAPEKPVATASTTAPTKQNVTVTAKFSGDSAVKEYSLDNKTWQSYTAGVVLKENGNVYFRAADAAGNVSETTKCKVANIDRTPPAKPSATADITAATNKTVTVTATFSSDSVVKEYSLDQKTWLKYTTGVVVNKNSTVYFRAADAAGNVSSVTSYAVKNIVDGKLFFSGTIKNGEIHQKTFSTEIDSPGRYSVGNASFGNLSGSITILADGKKVASGTIKNGVLTFNKNQPALLGATKKYTLVVKNTDKGRSPGDYSFTLTAKELFTKGDNSDDTLKGAKTLASGKTANDWVGYGDAVDYYKLGVNAAGGIYDLSLSGIKNNVRLTIYTKNGAKVKSVTASAKKPNIPLAGLCLDSGSYAVIEAPKAAKAQNSDYALKLTEKATFKRSNNDWNHAEALKSGTTFAGALTKAAGGDTVDYCDVSALGSLSFKTTAGKVKVSFFDTNKQAVKVAVKVAGGKDKTAAAVSLASGKVDRFTIGTLPSSVKYLKIEAAGKTLNSYTIGKIA